MGNRKGDWRKERGRRENTGRSEERREEGAERKRKRTKEKPILVHKEAKESLSFSSQAQEYQTAPTFSRFIDLRAESIDFTTPAIAPVT